jgi:putative inorganic carbon (HCO3(-)) transporter
LVAGPVLLIPLAPMAAALAVVVVLVAWAVDRRPATRRGSMPWIGPLALLLATVAVGAAISPVPDRSYPKLAGIALGVIVLRTVAVHAIGERRLWRCVALFVSCAVLVVAGGLVAALSGFSAADRSAGPSVNLNALGGTALLCLPLSLTLLRSYRAVHQSARETADGRWSMAWMRIGAGAAAAVLTVVILLSRSRTALLAACVTMVALAAWRSTRARLPIVAAAVVIAAALAIAGMDPVIRQIQRLDAFKSGTRSAGISVAARRVVWERASEAVREVPFTGLGLNAFRDLVHEYYPLPLVPRTIDIAHAHNVFLQTALDIGVPGLLAYLWLLGVALWTCGRLARTGCPAERALAAGLAGNLIAVHVFGLADAIPLGAKVGLFFWWNLGLIAALDRTASRDAAGPAVPSALLHRGTDMDSP